MTATVDVPSAYDRIAEKFLADRSVALREKMYLDLLLDGVRPGARVLDFGCGTGRPIAEYLIARDCAVTGVDGSVAMLAIARRIVPTARLVLARLETVELQETFAAIVAWDSLFHVERQYHGEFYEKFARWIRPGGRLLLSSGGTEHTGFTDQMHGETFFYSSWAPEKTTELLDTAGFEVERCELDQPEGRGHLAVLARKRT